MNWTKRIAMAPVRKRPGGSLAFRREIEHREGWRQQSDAELVGIGRKQHPDDEK